MTKKELVLTMASVLGASAQLENVPLRAAYKDCAERLEAATPDKKESLALLLVWIGAALELQQHYVKEILPASSLFRDDLSLN